MPRPLQAARRLLGCIRATWAVSDPPCRSTALPYRGLCVERPGQVGAASSEWRCCLLRDAPLQPVAWAMFRSLEATALSLSAGRVRERRCRRAASQRRKGGEGCFCQLACAIRAVWAAASVFVADALQPELTQIEHYRHGKEPLTVSQVDWQDPPAAGFVTGITTCFC